MRTWHIVSIPVNSDLTGNTDHLPLETRFGIGVSASLGAANVQTLPSGCVTYLFGLVQSLQPPSRITPCSYGLCMSPILCPAHIVRLSSNS